MTTLETRHIFLEISVFKYFVFWHSVRSSQKTGFDFLVVSDGFCIQDSLTNSKLLGSLTNVHLLYKRRRRGLT